MVHDWPNLKMLPCSPICQRIGTCVPDEEIGQRQEGNTQASNLHVAGHKCLQIDRRILQIGQELAEKNLGGYLPAARHLVENNHKIVSHTGSVRWKLAKTS